MSSGTKIVLAGGALPKNVFWQVAGLVELGTHGAHLEGVVLTQTAVTLRHGRVGQRPAAGADRGDARRQHGRPAGALSVLRASFCNASRASRAKAACTYRPLYKRQG